MAIRLYRTVLLLYPAEFRRHYREEMTQLLIDRHHHERRSTAVVLLGETIDAIRIAPRMRWESPMNRTVIIVSTATVAIAAAIAGQLLLLPVVLAALAAWWMWGRPPRPVAAAAPSPHWRRWVIGGTLAIGTAVTIPVIDGGELSEFWWTVAAAALLSGIAMTVTAIVLAAGHRQHPPVKPH